MLEFAVASSIIGFLYFVGVVAVLSAIAYGIGTLIPQPTPNPAAWAANSK